MITTILFYFLLTTSLYANSFKEYIKLRAIFHIHSLVSHNGSHTFEEIAKMAKERNIDVIGFSDHDFMRWEYGIPPLRNLIRKVTEYSSVSTYGFVDYISEIKKLEEKFPDMIFLAGIESAPFYFWEGNPFEKKLTIYDWHKHLLVFGLDSKSLETLPTASNPKGSSANSIYLIGLWPVFFILAGLLAVIIPIAGRLRVKIKNLHPLVPIKIPKLFVFIFLAIGITGAINNYPFKYKIDIYNGTSIEPYQKLIDYVIKRGGIVFWNHPEAGWTDDFGQVKVMTLSHPYDLLATYNYTGFAAFWEGYNKIAKAGEIWDKLLKEYIQGKRKSPIWAISELDWWNEGRTGTFLDSNGVIILVKEKTEKEILKALAAGKYYCWSERNNKIIVNDFSIEGLNSTGTIGDTVSFNDSVNINISISLEDKDEQSYEVIIIRDGEPMKVLQSKLPIDLKLTDTPKEASSYYRLEIKKGLPYLLTNPIFVKKHV